MIEHLLTGSAGGAVVVFFGWLLRESITASLQRELASEAEHLRHDLQREMLKAQLSTSKLHAIYPLLFEKLRRAEGAVAGLTGLQFVPSYDEYDRADFERVLEGLNLPGGEKRRIVDELDHNRRGGIDELNKTTRRVDIQRARQRLFGTKNHIILKALYVSEPVKAASLEVWQLLWSALVDIEVGADAKDFSMFKSAQTALESANSKLSQLEIAMRNELHPIAKSSA